MMEIMEQLSRYWCTMKRFMSQVVAVTTLKPGTYFIFYLATTSRHTDLLTQQVPIKRSKS